MNTKRNQIGSIKQSAVPDDWEAAKLELYRLLEEKARRAKQRMIDTIFPATGPFARDLYHKHMAFLAAGMNYRERVVFGGNRSGKSWLGGFETTLHLTGEYPDWWRGKRFSRPIVGIACGKDGKITRDSVQRILLGHRSSFGTGFIPGTHVIRDDCTMSRAASGLFDEVPVKHISGGTSILRFKSYDQGREAFEATELDWVWEDEEAPVEIHKENLMRTMTTHGSVINTFTPLKGETPLVRDLLDRATDGSVFQTKIWWDDCPHLTEEMIRDMMKRYSKHEIRARRYGEPQLGEGAIFTMDEHELMVRPMIIPDYWPRAFGMDFGWAHPTAVVWGALDRETGTVYLYSEHRRAQCEPAIHAAAIKARGDWIPGIADSAGTDMSSGKKMIDQYRKIHGLKLKKADKGPDSVEPGILYMHELMSEGRLKVFNTMRMWFDEYRSYHRDKNGKVHKVKDDLMDASRYLVTGIIKHAKTETETRIGGSAGKVVEVRFGRGRLG